MEYENNNVACQSTTNTKEKITACPSIWMADDQHWIATTSIVVVVFVDDVTNVKHFCNKPNLQGLLVCTLSLPPPIGTFEQHRSRLTILLGYNSILL